MGTRSTASLLAKLKEAPQSFGWNAIVAYDKDCANGLLAQEYIARFSEDSYLKAITTKIPGSEAANEYVVNLVLDRPRLSFERASVKWSQAKLVLKVIGGLHLNARTPLGQPEQLFKISSYDTLNGPELRMSMTLSVLLGEVDIKGRIAFDLSKGTEITLTYSEDPETRRLGGEFFRAYFDKLPDEKKIFVLNTIAGSEGQYLNPRNVQIRTQAASQGDADDGSGAILLFITMVDEEFGKPPDPDKDTDLVYLIPDDGATPYTTAILLDNRFFLEKFVEEGIHLLTGTSEPGQYDTTWSDSGFVETITLKKGGRIGLPRTTTALPNFNSVHLAGLETPTTDQSGKCSFTLTFDGDAVVMEWRGEKEQRINITTRTVSIYSHPLPSSWIWRRRYVFKVDPASNEMSWVPDPEGDQAYYKVSPGAYTAFPEVIGNFAELNSYVENLLYEQLQSCAADFVSPLKNIDVFRLNSILFKDHHVLHSVTAHLPGDVVIFGDIEPDADPAVNAFAVKPSEPLAGPGKNVEFAVVPAQPVDAGVSWRVENVAESSGSPGQIDLSSGAYTAPQADEFEGFFTRVRVTASKEGYSSSALLTVVARDITFNPLVAVCSTGETVEMSAKARDQRILEWSIVGPATGSNILPSTLEGGDHTYFAPPKEEAPAETFSLEEIQVQVKHSSPPIKYSSWILLTHKIINAFISIKADAGLPAGQLQLQAEKGEGPIESGCTWALLKGSGTIDLVSGIFSEEPVGQYPFALVTVQTPSPGPGWPGASAFIILPVPYVEWQKIKTIDEC